MVDIFPFGVAFDWEKDGEPTSTVLFERNCAIPSAKMLTFHRYPLCLSLTTSTQSTQMLSILKGIEFAFQVLLTMLAVWRSILSHCWHRRDQVQTGHSKPCSSCAT